MSHVIEVSLHGATTRVVIDAVLEVGRETGGLQLDDEEISRRHLLLSSNGVDLVVTDLGSTNGTLVNGGTVTEPTVLRPGDVVALGAVTISVLSAEGETPATPTPTLVLPTTPPNPTKRRPVLDELESRRNDAVVVYFRPGTAGEQAAAGVAQAARRARRKLAGFGAEPWGVIPTICLVDPFPDPEDPNRIMTTGTIVDASRNEIWMVVTSESPPEPLERPLAVCFGSCLPAADDLISLIEGYGLLLSGTADPDPELRGLDLPPLSDATGEPATAMALSFVRYLVERAGLDAFLQLLASAQPGRVERSAQEILGAGVTALEQGWRQKLAAGPRNVKAGQFLRLTARYLRPHVRREMEMFLYMLLGLGFTIVFPFVMRDLVDNVLVLHHGHFSQVLKLLGVLSAAFVISLGAGLRGAYLSAFVSGSVVRQLRREMFTQMQNLSQGWFTEHQQGDVLSRLFSDVGMLEQGLSQTLRNGLFQVLSLVVATVVLIVLDPWLAIVVLAGAPVIALVYKAMAKGALKRSTAVQEETGSMLAVASENYAAQSVVKAFGLQLREVGRFRQSSDRLFDRQVKLQLFGGLFGLSVNMIVTGIRVFILGLGGWLILHGHLTVGGLVAFMSLMGEVLSPVTVLTGIGQQIQSATGALVRINEVLYAPPEVQEGTDAVHLPTLTNCIELRDVGFAYTAERRTLEGINVRIGAGEKVAFVGPTGAGKSSILQLLMRFYDPDEGALLFDGIDVRHATVASLRSQLGVVFQDTFLFNATIGENITLARPDATDAEVEAVARAVELHDYIVSLPRGYDTLVGERGGRLSGGQRQRLSIARALLRDPRVLLLDEATSALDPRTERLIADTLDRVGLGRTTIAVTHRLTSITEYNRIYVIAEGCLVEEGTHAELLANPGLYAQLWAEQTGGHVPTLPPFDAATALSRVPLFAHLDPVAVADVADRFQAMQLEPGDSVPEGGGRLMLVRRGRAEMLAPNLAGELVSGAVLGPGDVFGLAALLGEEHGRSLRANEPLSLLVLTDKTLRTLATLHPSVGEVLTGSRAPTVSPAGGRRLSHLSIGPGVRPSVLGDIAEHARESDTSGPSADEIRRLTGTFRSVGP